MGKLKELNEKNFREAVAYEFAVISFWAPWCHACHTVMPAIEDMIDNYKGKATFYKVNVVDNPGLSSRYGVMSLPNILVFKKGKVIEQIIGAKDKGTLQKILIKNIG